MARRGRPRLQFSENTPPGGNGSGKSTALDVITGQPEALRDSRFNRTPFFERSLHLCRHEGNFEAPPTTSLTSC